MGQRAVFHGTNGDVGVHLESRLKQMRKIQVSTTYSSTYKEYVYDSSIYAISGNTLRTISEVFPDIPKSSASDGFLIDLV